MKQFSKNYPFFVVVFVAVILFAGCRSKKDRCADCPKWSKIEASRHHKVRV